jgi:hypothetical protein
MSDLIEQHFDAITKNGLNTNFFKILESTGVSKINGYLGALLENARLEFPDNDSVCYVRALTSAYRCLQPAQIAPEVSAKMHAIASVANALTEDQLKSTFAEIEVFGHLKSIFFDKHVKPINENYGRDGKTADYQVETDLFVEVYCPAISTLERTNVEKELKQQTDWLKTAISRPLTSSQPLAVQYSSNQIIAKVLNAKRENDQTVADAHNILWVDIKKKWQQAVRATLPLESVNIATHTTIGCFGIWHSFYGTKGATVFPADRFCLSFPDELPSAIYEQRDYDGLFRVRPTLSAAVISCVDGNVLFLNPWASCPLEEESILRLLRLDRFRPEYSFFMRSSLEQEVKAKEDMITFLLKANRTARAAQAE